MSIWYILIALLFFGLLIFIHEGGHYTAARIFGVTIKEFAIGMGPKLFSVVGKKNGIRYSFRALPIGGFVSMEGEDDDSADENSFRKKPVWQRIIITAAGAFMNLVLGFILMAGIVVTQDVLPSNVIGQFASLDDSGVCYAEAAGLEIGDRVVKIGDTKVYTANDLVYEVMRNGIEPLDVTVERNGETVVIEDVVFPTITEMGTSFGTVDFKVLPEEKTVLNVVKHSVVRSISTVKMIWESLYDLISGRYSMEAVSGPVGVTKALGEAAEEGAGDFVYLVAVISINLGVMNLLPFPALDGGRLVFQIIELVRRKSISAEAEGFVHFAGLVLLMLLMVVICVKDFIGLF